MTQTKFSRSRVESDISAFVYNLRKFAEHVGGVERVFAVLKANAYGHGAVACARAALRAGVKRLMVATCEEAAELRDAGIDAPLHILGTLDPQEYDDAFRHNLIPSIQNTEQAEQLSYACKQQGSSLAVHVKVDTGMGRLGMPAQSMMSELDKIISLPGLEVEGIFSHLGQAADTEISKAQIKCFNEVCAMLDDSPYCVPVRHLCNTTGTTLYPEAHSAGVRIGLGLYGMHDPRSLQEIFPLRPVLSWTTSLHLIKNYPVGASLGYGGTFTTKRPSRIGILPIGYADGYPRACSNRANVLVRGKVAPVVGTVSMDYTMIDLTDIPDVEQGDTVTLLGKDGNEIILAEDLSEWSSTIPYCITTGVSHRVGFNVLPATDEAFTVPL